MACFACGNADMKSVHRNFQDHPRIRYIAHAGAGIQLVECSNCEFISVEFIHPIVAAQLNQIEIEKPATSDGPYRAESHREDCLTQFNSWKQFLPSDCNRLLFWGAGRAENASLYSDLSTEVFASDLIPQHNKLAGEIPGVVVIETDHFSTPELEGTFDVIILSNVLERMAFPRRRLSLCSQLLKIGGIVLVEVQDKSHDQVRAGQYGLDEINFFNNKSLNALINNEGNLSTLYLDDVSRDGGGAVLRAALQNHRGQAGNPPPDIGMQDIASYLYKLSMACMLHSLSIIHYSEQSITDADTIPSATLDDH